MARFFVGQRVRVNCPRSMKHGMETVIIGPWHGVFSGWEVDLLSRNKEVGYCAFEEHELEPILPAHEPVAIAALLEEFPSLSGVLGVVA